MATSYAHERFPPELLLRFREISVEEEHRDVIPRQHRDQNWVPPTNATAFKITNQHDPEWLVYQSSSLRPLSNYERPPTEIHCTTSMFYCPRRYGFIHIDHDCLRQAEWNGAGQQAPVQWHPLTFEPSEARYLPNNQIWKVGINFAHREIPLPITDTWRDLLQPPYFKDTLHNSNQSPAFGLAGPLSVLLSLVAFAACWEDLETMVRDGFRPNRTTEYKPARNIHVPHERGGSPYRGIIVDVACRARGWNRACLNEVEAGIRGPILTSGPWNDRSVSTSAGDPNAVYSMPRERSQRNNGHYPQTPFNTRGTSFPSAPPAHQRGHQQFRMQHA